MVRTTLQGCWNEKNENVYVLDTVELPDWPWTSYTEIKFLSIEATVFEGLLREKLSRILNGTTVDAGSVLNASSVFLFSMGKRQRHSLCLFLQLELIT